jgi:hypothetical protein
MAPIRLRESRRKPLADLKRPRRRLGDELRPLLNCPLCVSSRINVIRWGEKTTRFECDGCGLRFSLDLAQLAGVLREPKRDRVFDSPLGGIYIALLLEAKGSNLADGGAEELGDFIDKARTVYPGGKVWRKPNRQDNK